jgi:hypothetical protein
MNPLLMLLMAMAQRRGGQGAPGNQRTPYGQMNPTTFANRNTTMTNYRTRMFGPGGELIQGGPTSNSAYTPQTWQFMNYLQNLYWNPGRMGNDTNPIGTQVFGGFERNGIPIGDNTFMQGGNPMNRPPASQQLGVGTNYDDFFGNRGGGGLC